MIDIFVEGRPIPQGSPGFRGRQAYQKPEVKAWREQIRAALADAGIEMRPRGTAVPVILQFSVPRTSTATPDIDKLARSVLDALTGIVYQDDSQVTYLSVVKHQGNPNGVRIII